MKTNTCILVTCVAASLLGAAAWWKPTTNFNPIAEHTIIPAVLSHAANDDFTNPEVLPSPAVSSLLDFDQQRLLGEIAATTDGEVLQLVTELFNATDEPTKGAAADALVRHGGYEAVANLLRIAGLQEGEEQRALVLSGLNSLSDDEGFATLTSVLAATRDPQFIDAAKSHLSRTASPAVLASLVELYRERNESPFQKNQVLETIAGLRHPDLSRHLGKLAHSAPEPALASAAKAAWQQLSGEDESL